MLLSQDIFTIYIVILLIQNSIIYISGYSRPQQPPLGEDGFGVYYREKDVLEIFNRPEFRDLPAVKATLYTYKEICGNKSFNLEHVDMKNLQIPLEHRQPFILVEGTHRNSRIIIAKELANYLRGSYLGNPPRSMVTLRKMFDRSGGVLRKAYFSLCMYVGAHHVIENWATQPVVSSGFWLDQAAFSIAHRYTLDKMPTRESDLFKWPRDLIKPDLAFFINIPKIKYGDGPPNLFRPRLIEAYRRMTGVPVIEINNTGLYDKIFTQIRHHLSKIFSVSEQDDTTPYNLLYHDY